MCNACGFVCCGLDWFEACGCDGCDEPDCWTPDDESEDLGNIDFSFPRCCPPARRARLICEGLPSDA
jgi:hypothetical protein